MPTEISFCPPPKKGILNWITDAQKSKRTQGDFYIEKDFLLIISSNFRLLTRTGLIYYTITYLPVKGNLYKKDQIRVTVPMSLKTRYIEE